MNRRRQHMVRAYLYSSNPPQLRYPGHVPAVRGRRLRNATM